ncbi:MAG: peptidase M15D vanX D-ala-D-ala dipeptidase [Bradyrhizobium sp.]|nr:MAG: peptidase M15D vanX D-ala-D-ala dipeptidase [Bradyrhizobium sp.]
MSAFFGELQGLRIKPIPPLQSARERRKNYRSHPIDTRGERHAEKLVDLLHLGIRGENFYNRVDNAPYYQRIPGSDARLLLRESVAARLGEVDERLRGVGLQIHVHDALRPVAVQKYFHDEWMPARVREKLPKLTNAEVVIEVEKYWAAPTMSPLSPAPHSTGGAVDLTLSMSRNSEPLYMGSIFDDVTDLAHTDFFEVRPELISYSDIEARQNRRLLYWVMAEAGFANNPNEWWHFSWGDQMWARLMEIDAAVFGLASE